MLYSICIFANVIRAFTTSNKRKLTNLHLQSKDTIWRTYTFYADGNLTVHYIPGGYSEQYVEYYTSYGLCAEQDSSFPTYKKRQPTEIAIAQGKSTTLYMGNTLTLKAKLKPEGTDAALTWKSSKPSVATVSETGVVKPVEAGKTVITVKTDNGLSTEIAIRVVDAKGVKIKEGKSAQMKVGKN